MKNWAFATLEKAPASFSYKHLCFNVAWVEVCALLVKAVRVNPENPFSRPKPIIWIGSWMVCCTTWDIEYPAHPTYQQVPSQTFALVATELLCREEAIFFRSVRTSFTTSAGPIRRSDRARFITLIYRHIWYMPYESAENPPVRLPLNPLGLWIGIKNELADLSKPICPFFAAKYSKTFLHQSKFQDFKTF